MSIPSGVSTYTVRVKIDDSWMTPDDWEALQPPPQLQGDTGPRLLHSGEGKPWIPQGLGHDPVHEQTLSTYNFDTENFSGDKRVLLSVQNTDTNPCAPEQEELSAYLGGTDKNDPTSGAPTKGGGVATDGEFIYVADSGEVYVYRREDVVAAGNSQSEFGGPHYATAVDKIDIKQGEDDTFSASYLTIHEGQLYVGDFTKSSFQPGDFPSYDAELRRYDLSAGNQPNHDVDVPKGSFDPSSYKTIEAPKNAQGATITDTGVIFTTSYGPSASSLHFQPTTDDFTASGDRQRLVTEDLPAYAEGVTIVDGKLWVTFESGADKYRDNGEPTDYIQIYDPSDLQFPGIDDLGID